MAKKKKKSLMKKAADAIDHVLHPDQPASEEQEFDSEEGETFDDASEETEDEASEEQPSEDVKPVREKKLPGAKKVRGKDLKFQN